MKIRRAGIARFAFVVAAPAVAAFSASSAYADDAGMYSATQVSSGRQEYSQKCASCHGVQMQGSGAPALKGADFAQRWNGKKLSDLYNVVHTEMPYGMGGSLPSQEYADIVSFVLAQNDLPAGTQMLTPRSSMEQVLDLKPSSSGSVASAPPGKVEIGALYGPVVQPATTGPTQAELDGADAAIDSWLMYNKGYRGERYSQLKQINADNAGQLRPICMFQLGVLGTFGGGPVMYDGMLYVTTHLNTYAIDAKTCRKVWSHAHVAQGAEMNPTNRGVAIAGGRVIRGAQDGFLYALDAKTGAPLWVRQVADWRVGEGIGAAPIVWNDLIFVGKAGSDWGIKGRMMAFNVADGSLAWTFDLVPQAGEPGAETWTKPESMNHGGAGAWVTVQLDRETGTLFIPVGNPGPDFNNAMRPGDNLFTVSTVALDAKSGTLKWWYQLRANDNHDWDATVVSLFDSDGRKLAATAGKEGVLHVINREDGKLVFKLPMTTLLNHDAPFTTEGVRVCPVAGVQWNGAAHSPRTGLLYVNAIDWCALFKKGPDPKWQPMIPFTGLSNGFGAKDPISKAWGWVNAVDPKTQKMAWRRKMPMPMHAGVTPTAGDVLFTGDLQGNFLTLDARDGRTLYSFNTGGPIAGGVITYDIDGRQYVAVASGNSGVSVPIPGAPTVVIFGQ